jgi:hypothetical protein
MNKDRLKVSLKLARKIAKEDPATEPVRDLDGRTKWVPAVVVPLDTLNRLIKAAAKELSRS